MKKIKLLSFAGPGELAQAAASAWLDEIESSRRDKPYCVALSGGRIAQTFFTAIVKLVTACKIGDGGTPSLPGNVHFFWADERCVPPDDPESNFRVAQELLFVPLKIPDAQIHRIRGEAAPEIAANEASPELSKMAPLNENSLPVLDLIFLGMGEDGHVASLFPNDPNVSISDKKIYRAVKDAPKPPPNRVTLGYATIVAAKQTWVLVSGNGKEKALAGLTDANRFFPAARVAQFRTRTKIFSDLNAQK